MNYSNIKIFKNEKTAREILFKGLDRFGSQKKLTSVDDIIRFFKEKLSRYIEHSWYGRLYISYIPVMSAGWIGKGQKIHTDNLFNMYIDPNFDIESLSDVQDLNEKNVAYSLLLSYYFDNENYVKLTALLDKIVKTEDLSSLSFTFDKTPEMYYKCSNMADYLPDGFIQKDDIINTRVRLFVAHYFRNNPDILSSGETYLYSTYISRLNNLANRGYIEDFMTDPMTQKMHTAVMTSKNMLEKNVQKVLKRSSYSSKEGFSILDAIESDQDRLITFLDDFKDKEDAQYFYNNCIKERDDYRLRAYIKELDKNKERLVEILNNFLYVRYAGGKKYAKLEKFLFQINSMFNVLSWDEYGLMDVIDGLPEKVQSAALKTMVGD